MVMTFIETPCPCGHWFREHERVEIYEDLIIYPCTSKDEFCMCRDFFGWTVDEEAKYKIEI